MITRNSHVIHNPDKSPYGVSFIQTANGATITGEIKRYPTYKAMVEDPAPTRLATVANGSYDEDYPVPDERRGGVLYQRDFVTNTWVLLYSQDDLAVPTFIDWTHVLNVPGWVGGVSNNRVKLVDHTLAVPKTTYYSFGNYRLILPPASEVDLGEEIVLEQYENVGIVLHELPDDTPLDLYDTIVRVENKIYNVVYCQPYYKELEDDFGNPVFDGHPISCGCYKFVCTESDGGTHVWKLFVVKDGINVAITDLMDRDTDHYIKQDPHPIYVKKSDIVKYCDINTATTTKEGKVRLSVRSDLENMTPGAISITPDVLVPYLQETYAFKNHKHKVADLIDLVYVTEIPESGNFSIDTIVTPNVMKDYSRITHKHVKTDITDLTFVTKITDQNKDETDTVVTPKALEDYSKTDHTHDLSGLSLTFINKIYNEDSNDEFSPVSWITVDGTTVYTRDPANPNTYNKTYIVTPQVLDDYSRTDHKHIIADTDGLQEALNNRSLVGHKHVLADITDYTPPEVIRFAMNTGDTAINVSPFSSTYLFPGAWITTPIYTVSGKRYLYVTNFCNYLGQPDNTGPGIVRCGLNYAVDIILHINIIKKNRTGVVSPDNVNIYLPDSLSEQFVERNEKGFIEAIYMYTSNMSCPFSYAVYGLLGDAEKVSSNFYSMFLCWGDSGDVQAPWQPNQTSISTIQAVATVPALASVKRTRKGTAEGYGAAQFCGDFQLVKYNSDNCSFSFVHNDFGDAGERAKQWYKWAAIGFRDNAIRLAGLYINQTLSGDRSYICDNNNYLASWKPDFNYLCATIGEPGENKNIVYLFRPTYDSLGNSQGCIEIKINRTQSFIVEYGYFNTKTFTQYKWAARSANKTSSQFVNLLGESISLKKPVNRLLNVEVIPIIAEDKIPPKASSSSKLYHNCNLGFHFVGINRGLTYIPICDPENIRKDGSWIVNDESVGMTDSDGTNSDLITSFTICCQEYSKNKNTEVIENDDHLTGQWIAYGIVNKSENELNETWIEGASIEQIDLNTNIHKGCVDITIPIRDNDSQPAAYAAHLRFGVVFVSGEGKIDKVVPTSKAIKESDIIHGFLIQAASTDSQYHLYFHTRSATATSNGTANSWDVEAARTSDLGCAFTAARYLMLYIEPYTN